MTIHLYDAELRSMSGGTIIEDEYGHQLGHWPMGTAEAADQATDEYPGEHIVIHEVDASALGRRGGRSRSRAKIKAARANGKLGGRPRKAK